MWSKNWLKKNQIQRRFFKYRKYRLSCVVRTQHSLKNELFFMSAWRSSEGWKSARLKNVQVEQEKRVSKKLIFSSVFFLFVFQFFLIFLPFFLIFLFFPFPNNSNKYKFAKKQKTSLFLKIRKVIKIQIMQINNKNWRKTQTCKYS